MELSLSEKIRLEAKRSVVVPAGAMIALLVLTHNNTIAHQLAQFVLFSFFLFLLQCIRIAFMRDAAKRVVHANFLIIVSIVQNVFLSLHAGHSVFGIGDIIILSIVGIYILMFEKTLQTKEEKQAFHQDMLYTMKLHSIFIIVAGIALARIVWWPTLGHFFIMLL